MNQVRKLFPVIFSLVIFQTSIVVAKQAETTTNCNSPLNVEVRTLNENKIVNLCEEYKGKVILIVNTASKCGYTNQYEGLEKLYKTYKDNDFVVLGFPSNDFANQEPGTEEQIKSFCRLTYGVQFPMFAKTRVRKKYADPLYQKLGKITGEFPKWNFHKYLLDRSGEVVAHYPSSTKPFDKKLVNKIKLILKTSNH